MAPLEELFCSLLPAGWSLFLIPPLRAVVVDYSPGERFMMSYFLVI